MYRILVIDDEQPILNLLQLALSKFGYHVETAVDGREGIKKFESQFVDVVITDACMPGMGGDEVARHIRNSRRKTTPIIAISGTPWLLNDGYFDKVLAKPFPLKTLYDTLEHLAGKPTVAVAVR